jgi:hypothetical protein
VPPEQDLLEHGRNQRRAEDQQCAVHRLGRLVHHAEQLVLGRVLVADEVVCRFHGQRRDDHDRHEDEDADDALQDTRDEVAKRQSDSAKRVTSGEDVAGEHRDQRDDARHGGEQRVVGGCEVFDAKWPRGCGGRVVPDARRDADRHLRAEPDEHADEHDEQQPAARRSLVQPLGPADAAAAEHAGRVRDRQRDEEQEADEGELCARRRLRGGLRGRIGGG